MFVLRAVNKMHKHTYTEYLCECVCLGIREQLRCFMCAGCSSMRSKETLRGARPQTKPHNLHVCRPKRNYSIDDRFASSHCRVRLSSSRGATIGSRSSCQRLRRSSLRRASSSVRADKPVMQRRYLSRGYCTVCSGVTVNLV